MTVGGCADSKLPQVDAMFFQRRELCFTLDGDIFVRYQSFKVQPHIDSHEQVLLPVYASAPQQGRPRLSLSPFSVLQDREELQRAMANKVPAKIDIGPVYNVDPQRRKAYTGAQLPSSRLTLSTHGHSTSASAVGRD